MNKPHFHHITTIINGLINLEGTKSLLKISEHMLTAKSSSSIYRFLSHSKWNDSLIDRNRINYLKLHFNKLIKPKSVEFLAIDDTANPKIQAKEMENLGCNYCHTEGKNHNKTFMGKSDIAIDFINSFEKPSNCFNI